MALSICGFFYFVLLQLTWSESVLNMRGFSAYFLVDFFSGTSVDDMARMLSDLQSDSDSSLKMESPSISGTWNYGPHVEQELIFTAISHLHLVNLLNDRIIFNLSISSFSFHTQPDQAFDA